MLEIYLLGDSGTGVGKLDREGKEAKTDCVNEHIMLWAAVVQSHCGSPGDGVEHGSGFSHPRGQQAGVYPPTPICDS